MFTDSIQLGSIIAFLTILASVGGLGFKVRDWFGKLQDRFDTSIDRIKDMVDKHEVKDQERFYEINIRLARMGNGSPGIVIQNPAKAPISEA